MVRLLLLALNLVPELALWKAAFIFTGSGSRLHLQHHMSPGNLCLIQERWIDYSFQTENAKCSAQCLSWFYRMPSMHAVWWSFLTFLWVQRFNVKTKVEQHHNLCSIFCLYTRIKQSCSTVSRTNLLFQRKFCLSAYVRNANVYHNVYHNKAYYCLSSH